MTTQAITIDLSTFEVGDTVLGERPSEADFFAVPLQKSDVFEVAANGIELGSKDGVLDYAFLTIESFNGQFRSNGEPIAVGRDSTEATIKRSFGEPYWIDRSDGEIIMFYEYAEGTIELQFEFPGSGSLGFVTLSRNGVLSTEEQRKLYGVDKPWPPK
ncbi:MAG: hypothetical protein ABJQ29_08945 [Luteolibacter sp.]